MTHSTVQDSTIVARQELLRIGSTRLSTIEQIEVLNPATGEVVGSCPNATDAQVAAAIDAAADAFEPWRTTTAADRAEVLRRLADLMIEDQSELARLVTLEVGKPLVESLGEVEYAAEFARWYAEETRRVYGRVTYGSPDEPWRQLIRQPLGVIGAITPWNYPLVLAARKVFAAIAAGCTVVLKPSELAPLAAYRLGGLAERAGLPHGVLNIVTAAPPNRVGDAFSADPRVRKISFTGSVPTGKSLMRSAARTLTRVGLELGGNNAFIVFEDADLDLAVHGAVHAKLRNGGQTCVAANRYLVHESLLDEFAARLGAELQDMTVGPGIEPSTEIGPLIDHKAVARIRSAVDAAVSAGATLVCGGHDVTVVDHPDGAFYPPTVLLNVAPTSTLMTEEIFGPVAPIIGFRDFEEAITVANSTEHGLAAYLFTSSLATAIRGAEQLEAGIVVVNRPAPSGVEYPQGGIKQSGIGVEGGPEGLEEFTTCKYLALGV